MKIDSVRLHLRIAALICLSTFIASQANATCPSTPLETGVAAAPSRPNYANTADILQEGVTEFEYGFSHSWVSGGTTQSDLPGLIRFAPFCNVEIRLGSDNLMQVSSDGATTRGIGDSWLTTEYEIRRQTRYFPAVAFSYGTKFPTANEGNGLGSGEYDHAFAFLVNKSVGKTVVTFNATRTLVGRPAGPGFDHSMFCARNFARPLRGRVGFTGEFYGASRLNAQTRGYAGTLWAVTHTMNPRFVLDGGVDLGLTAGIPHQRA